MAWPLVMIGALWVPAKVASLRNRCIIAVGVITTASLLACLVINATRPAAAFYLPFTRAWELGIGSALALLPACAAAKQMRTVAGFAGLALVLTGFIVIRESASFPFPLALLPTFGTGLILWAGEWTGAPVSRLLATRPFVSIGRVSYALYLWHWPLLSFANIFSVGTPSITVRVTCVVVSLLLSYPTVALVENPIRFGYARRVGPMRTVVAGLTSGLALIACATGIYAAARFGLLGTDPMIAAAIVDVPPRTTACLRFEGSAERAILPLRCLANEGSPRIVLWGDSYANQWRPSLDEWQQNHRAWNVEQVTAAVCPPLLGVRPNSWRNRTIPYEECLALNNAVAHRLQQPGNPPTVVVLAANWAARAGGDPPIGLPPKAAFFDLSANNIQSSLNALARGLENTLALLDQQKLRSVVVLQSPQFARPPAACVQRLGADACALRRSDFDSAAASVNQVIRYTVARHRASIVLDPAVFLCSANSCPVVSDGHVAYFDNSHVAASRARAPSALRIWEPALNHLTQATH